MILSVKINRYVNVPDSGRYRENGRSFFLWICDNKYILMHFVSQIVRFWWCSGLRLPRCIVLCIDKRWSFFSQFMKQHFPLRHDVSEWVAFYILFSSFAKSFSFCFMFYQVAKSVGKSLYVSVFDEESVFLVSDDFRWTERTVERNTRNTQTHGFDQDQSKTFVIGA